MNEWQSIRLKLAHSDSPIESQIKLDDCQHEAGEDETSETSKCSQLKCSQLAELVKADEGTRR